MEGKRAQFADESMIKAMCEAMGFYDERDRLDNCSIEFLLLTHTFFSIILFFFLFFFVQREKALRFFCTQKEKGNKRDQQQNSSHSSSLDASGHHHQPVAKRVVFGNDKKKNGPSTRSRSSRLVSSVARTRFLCRTMSSCLFG